MTARARRWLVWGSAWAALVGACDERGAAPPDATAPDATPDADVVIVPPEDYEVPESAPPAIRRLSARELANTYRALVGVEPAALAEIPPDPRDHTYDRIANAQTTSLIHLEAYDRAAREAAATLLAERRLDELAPACADALMPPAAPEATTTVSGIALVAYPDWALVPGDGAPERLMIRYAPECGVSTSHAAPVDGAYRVALDLELVDRFDVTLTIDGEVVASWDEGADVAGPLVWEGPLSSGPHQVAFDFVFTGAGNPYVWVSALTITGPIDPSADAIAERAACADALIEALAPRAFRRPVTAAERQRLGALHADALAEGGTFAEATSLVLRAILASPKTLYLVEGGAPIEGAPRRFALDDHALAARLSYALCESPPDDALRARADAGELADPTILRAEARRLLDLPCARATLARFYRQWLWLDRLPSTAKDPAVFPTFTTATSESLLREADRFFEVATFEERQGFAALHTTRRTFVDALAAELYGVTPTGAPDESGLVEVTLPPERAGLLTLGGVLAVTSKFSQTSPVIRGVWVLEQILCEELPSPPQSVDTTPPPLDPSATTRERWAAHSESEACRPCHEQIDPIGFLFESFDATGRYRTHEGALPIDSHGAVPALGAAGGDLDGVASLAAVVATSERATSCLARQWLRFTLGRLEEVPDAASLAEVARALADGESLVDALVALVGTSAFRERVERGPGPSEVTP
ncbi:MAG: DUF1592 domain-containing protein [Deltaproteobacteria bacterium]|nr:DUF1592 domain-containing protein [Deltaproteobacteria bacterium]